MGAWGDAKKIIEQTEREAEERRRRASERTPENPEPAAGDEAPEATPGETTDTGPDGGTDSGHGVVPAARGGEPARA